MRSTSGASPPQRSSGRKPPKPAELVQAVRGHIGAIAALTDVTVVQALPKTRSGKILRCAMRAMTNGAAEPVPATIEDPSVLESLRPVPQRSHDAESDTW
ncbi:AMP-binding enzyme [Streptomyces spiralis]